LSQIPKREGAGRSQQVPARRKKGRENSVNLRGAASCSELLGFEDMVNAGPFVNEEVWEEHSAIEKM